MTPDEKHELYYGGYNDGLKHAQPSQETLRMFDNIKNQMDDLKQDLKADIAEVKEMVREIRDSKADKWVESFSKGLMVLMATSFVSLLAYLGVKIFESIYK